MEYVLESGKQITVLITSNMPAGVSVVEEGDQKKIFKNLEELIKNYSKTLVKPFASEYHREPYAIKQEVSWCLLTIF